MLTAARTSLGFQFQSLASASPVVVEQLGLSYGDLGTLIGLYFLPGVVMALPGGALGRRFCDKWVVAFGLVLMLAGGGLASLARDFAGLAAGRVLSGVGGVLLNVVMAKRICQRSRHRHPAWRAGAAARRVLASRRVAGSLGWSASVVARRR